MQHAVFRKILAVLFGLVLAATGLWASPAGEEEPAAAMEKEMVTDPATGKVVTAPEYGGTLTYPFQNKDVTTDPFLRLATFRPISSVALMRGSPGETGE